MCTWQHGAFVAGSSVDMPGSCSTFMARRGSGRCAPLSMRSTGTAAPFRSPHNTAKSAAGALRLRGRKHVFEAQLTSHDGPQTFRTAADREGRLWP